MYVSHSRMKYIYKIFQFPSSTHNMYLYQIIKAKQHEQILAPESGSLIMSVENDNNCDILAALKKCVSFVECNKQIICSITPYGLSIFLTRILENINSIKEDALDLSYNSKTPQKPQKTEKTICTVQETKNKNQISTFIDTHCEITSKPGDTIPLQILYAKYKLHKKVNRLSIHRKDFYDVTKSILINKGCIWHLKKRNDNNRIQQNVISGIKCKGFNIKSQMITK